MNLLPSYYRSSQLEWRRGYVGKQKLYLNHLNLKLVSIELGNKNHSNQICGSVRQLFNYKEHNGLFIELHGLLMLPGYKAPRQLLQNEKCEKNDFFQYKSRVYQQLAGDPFGATLVKTKSLENFNFILNLPPDLDLPPSFLSSFSKNYAEYRLLVFLRDPKANGKPILIENITIPYSGKCGIPRKLVNEKSPQIFKITVKTGPVNATVQIPKRNFLLGEDIPFKVMITDEEKDSVKKISLTLLKNVTLEEKFKNRTEAEVLDCVVFKRFLKGREQISRNGKFKRKYLTSASYLRNGKFKLKIDFAIELKITTIDGSSVWDQLPLSIGTHLSPHYQNPTAPSAHEMEDIEDGLDNFYGPSAPLEENPWASAPFYDAFSLSGSLLSLLPPTYSQLSSRSSSIASFATLPPHYDDVEDEQQVNKNKLFYFSKFLSKSNISLHKSDKGLVAGGQQTSVNYEN